MRTFLSLGRQFCSEHYAHLQSALVGRCCRRPLLPYEHVHCFQFVWPFVQSNLFIKDKSTIFIFARRVHNEQAKVLKGQNGDGAHGGGHSALNG